MNIKRRLIYLAILNASFVGCIQKTRALSHQKTDLGVGNMEVARRFESYKSKQTHCAPDANADYRVILAGFGPFGGREINTSSLIAMNFTEVMANRSPETITPSITDKDFDGVIRQGVFNLNNKKIAVCAIETSVIWDLAGAIYLYEANLFRPELIIMAGMDGGNNFAATWETHTDNVAASINSYENDGTDSSISPIAPLGDLKNPIVDGGEHAIDMTWDAKQLTRVTDPMIKLRLPGFTAQTGSDETSGDYLCNNVSYIVLAGLTGKALPLAGGKLQISTSGLAATRAGFLHYPWKTPQDSNTVRIWVDVLAAAIETEMTRK